MAITDTQASPQPSTTTKIRLWLRRVGRTIKPNRIKTGLVLACMLAIIFGALASYLANASRFPEAINMSSTMHTHSIGSANLSVATPMASLTQGDSDAPLVSYTLTAEVVRRPGLPDQWGFNGTVPGPELRVQQGDHVQVTLVNNLSVATTIHWHGMNVPNAADGVAGVTQDAVQPGQSFTYDFIAVDAGTYWYHSHQDTSNQIPRGLLGALIVEPENLPHYDRDYSLVYHDHLAPSRELPSVVQRIAGDIDENAIAVNGTNADLHLTAAPGELVRLRLINGSAGEHGAFGDPLRIVPLGIDYQVVALDGHDLNEPEAISRQVLPIGAGQRYDLVFRMPDVGAVHLLTEDQRAAITLGEGELPSPDLTNLPTFDLTNYGSAAPDPVASRSSFDVMETLVLGNRPGFHNGDFGLNHTINGHEFPDVPMISVEPGQSVRLHIVNETDEYHPMHIHGHYFTVLSRNNVPLSGSPIDLDSILLAPFETWDVAFIANNPGLWMLHCHVLVHAATGMDMMVVYPNISTPYVVGENSGNIPE